jgi:hypothetical protein
MMLNAIYENARNRGHSLAVLAKEITSLLSG